MEIIQSLSAFEKPVFSEHIWYRNAPVTIADTIFLTILQKRGNRRNDSPLDNMKMQVA